MSKKSRKKGKTINMPLSPKNYVRQRARNLPIYMCLINSSWREDGLATVYIARQHTNGKITYGSYLVDLLCLGLKDTSFEFNILETSFQEMISDFPGEHVLEPIDYETAHNIIFGAIEFAEEYGFAPHKDFNITKYILEEDDENVELVDIEFGEDGKPLLVTNPENDFVNEIATLEKTAGPGNYHVVTEDGLLGYEDDDLFDDEEPFDDLEEIIKEGIAGLDEIAKWEQKDWTEFAKGEKEVSMFPVNYVIKLGLFKLYEEEEINNILDEFEEFLDVEISEELTLETFGLHGQLEFKPLVSGYKKIDNNLENRDIKYSIRDMKLLIERFPDVPFLYTRLCTYYMIAGMIDEMEKEILSLYDKFPDYMLSKLFYVNYLIEKDRLNEIPGILGNNWGLQAIEPGREVFHYIEVVAYAQILIGYYTSVNQLLKAQLFYDMLVEYEYDGFISELLLMDLTIAVNRFVIKAKYDV